MANDYSPRQQLFDSLFRLSELQGNTTHLNNPGLEVSYPFVVIDPVVSASRKHGKHRLAGNLIATIHVWSHEHEVGDHDSIMFRFERTLMNLKELDSVYLELESLNPRSMNVTEGDDKLQHGIIQVNYKFY